MALTGSAWIPLTCAVFAFFASMGMGRWNSVSFKDIGGNDVANSFATSVGAKALTMKQTIIIASICEFSGAMLLGSHVTATIKGGIVVGSLYKDDPNELMFGMLTVVLGVPCGLSLQHSGRFPFQVRTPVLEECLEWPLLARD